MSDDPERPTSRTLLSEALQQLSSLVRGEVALARAEVEENIRSVVAGVGLILVGSVLALTALNVLAAALVAALAAMGVPVVWAALGVGSGLALIALLFALKGAQAFKSSRLAPHRTLRNLRSDAETLKEIVTNGTSK